MSKLLKKIEVFVICTSVMLLFANVAISQVYEDDIYYNPSEEQKIEDRAKSENKIENVRETREQNNETDFSRAQREYLEMLDKRKQDKSEEKQTAEEPSWVYQTEGLQMRDHKEKSLSFQNRRYAVRGGDREGRYYDDDRNYRDARRGNVTIVMNGYPHYRSWNSDYWSDWYWDDYSYSYYDGYYSSWRPYSYYRPYRHFGWHSPYYSSYYYGADWYGHYSSWSFGWHSPFYHNYYHPYGAYYHPYSYYSPFYYQRYYRDTRSRHRRYSNGVGRDSYVAGTARRGQVRRSATRSRRYSDNLRDNRRTISHGTNFRRYNERRSSSRVYTRPSSVGTRRTMHTNNANSRVIYDSRSARNNVYRRSSSSSYRRPSRSSLNYRSRSSSSSPSIRSNSNSSSRRTSSVRRSSTRNTSSYSRPSVRRSSNSNSGTRRSSAVRQRSNRSRRSR